MPAASDLDFRRRHACHYRGFLQATRLPLQRFLQATRLPLQFDSGFCLKNRGNYRCQKIFRKSKKCLDVLLCFSLKACSPHPCSESPHPCSEANCFRLDFRGQCSATVSPLKNTPYEEKTHLQIRLLYSTFFNRFCFLLNRCVPGAAGVRAPGQTGRTAKSTVRAAARHPDA